MRDQCDARTGEQRDGAGRLTRARERTRAGRKKKKRRYVIFFFFLKTQ